MKWKKLKIIIDENIFSGSAAIDQKNSTKSNKTNNNNGEVNRNEDNAGDCKNAKKKTGPGGPLLHQAWVHPFTFYHVFTLKITVTHNYYFFFLSSEVSSSQLDFFRMLDEKIENVSVKDWLENSKLKIL